MGDRVSVSITIGGHLPATLVDDFVSLLQAERLSTEWGGEIFDRGQFPQDAPLTLFAHEVHNGEIADVEDFCCTNDLPFVRWSGASGSFDAEIVIWTGQGERHSFAADDNQKIVLGEDEARQLGSYEAITAHFAEGAYEPPAFSIAS
jgi:hypothetical protein